MKRITQAFTRCVACSLSGLMLGLAAPAAENPPGQPAPSNVAGREYPRILPDLRVVFRLKAPNAQEVLVAPKGKDNGLGPEPFPMQRDSNGVWEVTTPPVRPGFHYYELVVDGLRLNDPNSETFFGWGQPTSGLEVPDPQLDFYHAKEVPHGEVRAFFYHSKITGTLRRAFVYTPPAYERMAGQRFPVLYLQHGAGESERAWSVQGRVNFILDNLIAARKAKPMIVVMDNGYARPAGSTNTPGSRGTEAFGQVLMLELIPLIDVNYRTLPDRRHRALAGLSMGAGQALQVGLANLDAFGWIGAFSGGFRDFKPAESYGGIFRDAPRLNNHLRLLWLSMGRADPGYEAMKNAHLLLDDAHVRHVWFETEDAHEWQAWRKHFYEFAQRLFKDSK